MATLDVTIVNLALPAMQREFSLSNAGLAFLVVRRDPYGHPRLGRPDLLPRPRRGRAAARGLSGFAQGFAIAGGLAVLAFVIAVGIAPKR